MDDYVDIEFGTGCLKVTPAHDVNDYMLGEKYNLPSIDIFNDNGTISEAGGLYVGMDRFDVRKQIAKDLQKAGLLEKVEDYDNKVGYSERTNVVIEPKLSMQWFVKMDKLAAPALDAVMKDEIKFHPDKFKNIYRHWMENIKDWCISRQLWWGHRIPAYYLPQGGFVVAATPEEALKYAERKVVRPTFKERSATRRRLPRHMVLFVVMAHLAFRWYQQSRQRRNKLLLPDHRFGYSPRYHFLLGGSNDYGRIRV